jgi:hypothetical protein
MRYNNNMEPEELYEEEDYATADESYLIGEDY